MAQGDGTLLIEDAQLRFLNFAGAETQYNRGGDRNFCVLIDPALADTLAADGWNVKMLKAREEGDVPTPYLEVSVSYKNKPPNVAMITSRGRTQLSESMVEMLDYADIKLVDLIINPYAWDVNGKQGIKAYLKTMFVTINEDALDLKYNTVPDTTPADGPSPIDPPWDAGQTP